MEKRNSRRFETDTPICCSFFNTDRKYDAQLINFSKDGMCFKCHAAFKERCTFFFRINGMPGANAIDDDAEGFRSISLAEVKWLKEVTEGEDRYFTIGARYFPHY